MSWNENTALHVIYVRCMCVVGNKTLYYIHSTQSYMHTSDVFSNRALVDASEETVVQCPTQGCFIVQTGGVREGTTGSGSSRVVQGVIRKFKNQRTLPYLNIVRQTEVSSPKVVPPTAGICASYAGSLLVSFCSGSRTNVVNRLLHS